MGRDGEDKRQGKEAGEYSITEMIFHNLHITYCGQVGSMAHQDSS